MICIDKSTNLNRDTYQHLVQRIQLNISWVVGYYSTQNWGNKWFHAFLKGISLKVNVVALLEFELT